MAKSKNKGPSLYNLFNIIKCIYLFWFDHFYMLGQKLGNFFCCFFGRVVDTTISSWNFLTFKASVGNFKDAEEIFLQVQSDKLQNDYAYLSWLARCYIMNGKARLAWELYLKMETSKCLHYIEGAIKEFKGFDFRSHFFVEIE